MTPPSVWAHWPSIRKQLSEADEIVLFLDYDGTLAPIRGHPSQAKLPLETAQLLSELASTPNVWIALVSGRSLKELKRMVGLRGVCYVGNHGLEIQGPRFRHVNPVARHARPLLKKIAEELEKTLKPISGAWVENKGLTLALHYRQVTPDHRKVLVKNRFFEVIRPYQEKKLVRETEGKEVFEVRPPVHWGKGTVVQWLLTRHQAFHSKAKVFPLYVGDDQTDEDAFQALKGRGITVAVGPSRLTLAQYTLFSPQEVRRLLRCLLQVRLSGCGRGKVRRRVSACRR